IRLRVDQGDEAERAVEPLRRVVTLDIEAAEVILRRNEVIDGVGYKRPGDPAPAHGGQSIDAHECGDVFVEAAVAAAHWPPAEQCGVVAAPAALLLAPALGGALVD